MPSTSAVEHLIARNRTLAPFIRPHPLLGEMMQQQGPPSTLFIACLDPRSDPREVFGLQANELAIIRNVGGRAGSVLVDIAAFLSVVPFENIVILHHTDCGTTYMDEKRMRDNFQTVGGLTLQNAKELRLPCQADVEQGVRQDIELIRSCKFINDKVAQNTFGFVFDIKTGEVTQIC